jgi:UDP-GlcNAc:undecaprenyl-phosphate/decaprenyl-phosphate GlcNAc-1-phosphate transferase
MAIVGLVVSLVVGWLLVRFEGLHAHLSHDHAASGPQKFHSRPTPRIGGIPIGAGFASALAVGVAGGALESELVFAFGLAVLPAYLSGLVEDVTKKIGPDIRLWASFLSALIAIYFFDAVVDRSGIAPVDALLAWYPIALVFTVVGIGGVAHAVNIIDGYNGLASMVTLLMLGALGSVSWLVGDLPLAALCVALGAGTLGFFRWNFPWGRIFAGDGGAYLWGVSIAIISVLLITRNPQVSPWFPLAVAIYPVFETLFSVYRRKFKHAAAAGLPDAKHLHQLVYRRLLFRGAEYRVACPDLKTLRNASASPFLWLLASSSIVPALLFWNQGPALAGITGVFCLLYVWHYRAITTHQTPRWLHRLAAAVSRTALATMRRRHAAGPAVDQPARDAT